MIRIVLYLAALVSANRLLSQRAGGVSDPQAITSEQLTTWNNALHRSNDLGMTSTDLEALGQPTSVQTQVVAGTNYIFTFSNGVKVTVWEQTWTDKLEVTSVEQPEPTLGQNGVGPSWTYGVGEAPQGVRDMGGYTVNYYTPEQQARLGITETGEKAQMLGEDPVTWGPHNAQVLGDDPQTWSPQEELLGADPKTWGPQTELLGADPKTWGPQAELLGEDPETWAPQQTEEETSNFFNMLMPQKTYVVPDQEPAEEKLGEDPATWGPQTERLGQDPSTWGPQTEERLGEDPVTWGPQTELLGADPATWGPQTERLGQDPATWSPNTPEEASEDGSDSEEAKDEPVLGRGSIGPRWTWDSSVEKPAGTKDMGSWQASVYTEEQQQRLGVNELGEPVAETEPMLGKGGVGPQWTFDPDMEPPAGTKDMGGWEMSVYTEEQQHRLGVSESGEKMIGGEGGVGPESTWEDDDDSSSSSSSSSSDDHLTKVHVLGRIVKQVLGI